jgi:hypothetical protein
MNLKEGLKFGWNSISRYCTQRKTFLLASLAFLLCVASGFAVQPPPGGGYPNGDTALGTDALAQDNPGADNTGIGFEALDSVTSTGSENTAVGRQALFNTTTGPANTAVGWQAALGNTTGQANVAVGENALVSNSTGGYNVAVGEEALEGRASGYSNVAVGPGAMELGNTGSYNVAVGSNAMAFYNGTDNVAIGDSALNMASGSFNVALGYGAGLNFAGNNNVAIGEYAGQNVTSGTNNIEIANQGAKKDDAAIRIGDIKTQKKTFIAGINGVTVSNGVAVMVNAQGQLGVATSSARFKDDIKPMKDVSDVLLSLQPVTFRYKKELDSLGTPQFGLVAEQVAKVDPDLVARDDSGKPYAVRYEAVNAMLLNEFLKEHRTVEADHATIAGQQEEIAELKATVKESKSQVQRVSAQVQANAPAPRLAGVGGE